MPKRSKIPIEERKYGHIYFVLAALLAITTFWAILDMIRFRAPWQGYQKQLKKIEYENVNSEYEAAKEDFQANYQDRYNELKQALRQAQTNLEGEAYEELLKELDRAEANIREALQNYRFAKSEYDALWYEYKEAEHHGDESKINKLRSKVDELNKEVGELKVKWDDAEAEKVNVEGRLARYRSTVDSLQSEIAKLEAPLEELQTRLNLIEGRKIKIEQIRLPNFVRGNFENFLEAVDRCTSCHVNTDKGGYNDFPPPFQTHPDREIYLKIHPVNDFGCTPCHEGQGPALQKDPAHGFVKFWEHPLLKGDLIEAGCNKCHSKEFSIDHAPNLTKAKRMVFDLGCYACHEIAGYENARKIGPPLNAITSKTTPEFIYRWVRNTKSFRKYTRMPNPQFTHQEALAVTAYLADISKSTDYELPKARLGGSAQRGRKLVASVGCTGCHVVTEKDREVRKTDVPYDIAPELTKIGSKVSPEWLYGWIKNPKQYNPNTTMPNLRLTDSEARDIVAYLVSLKETDEAQDNFDSADLESEELISEGKAIIRNFGCHGCHEIEGMEGEGKVSVSLNEFGAKTPEELFFGDALANGDVSEETWEAWTLGKLRNSRMYSTETVIQRMPNFEFTEESARTLAILLKSWDGRVIGKDYLHDMGSLGEALENGRRLVRQYNCIGCHVIEGEGGFIRTTLVEAFKQEGRTPEDAISFAPPDLIGEGRKVQPKWLFGFLKNPTTNIRPWLDIRMPTFGLNDEEVNQLIAYFQALEGMSEPFMEVNIELTRREVKAAEKLFSNDYLSCFSCHQVGRKKPEGPPSGWAPDFLLAPDRLNPQWVFDWIADPQALQPGTRMPSFYPDAAPPDILDGDPNKQIEALRDYLMSIREFVKK
jgi:mono/diheme cytochrome c family protein/predicted nuclease with TOPRIM domain